MNEREREREKRDGCSQRLGKGSFFIGFLSCCLGEQEVRHTLERNEQGTKIRKGKGDIPSTRRFGGRGGGASSQQQQSYANSVPETRQEMRERERERVTHMGRSVEQNERKAIEEREKRKNGASEGRQAKEKGKNERGKKGSKCLREHALLLFLLPPFLPRHHLEEIRGRTKRRGRRRGRRNNKAPHKQTKASLRSTRFTFYFVSFLFF